MCLKIRTFGTNQNLNMVVFVCGSCQESLNRGKVSQHGARCRFSYVSCLDCGVHFHGEDFQTHIKCISEQEKYTGKKDKKQDVWEETIENALGALKQQPNQIPYNALKSIVDRVGALVVPKLKKKLVNMCHSTNQRLTDATIELMWAAIETAKREHRLAVEQKQAENKRQRLERQAEKDDADFAEKRKAVKRALKQAEGAQLLLADLAAEVFDGNKKACKLAIKRFPDDFKIEKTEEGGKRMVKRVN